MSHKWVELNLVVLNMYLVIETNDIFINIQVYGRHYLFDVEMFTHVDLTSNATFTTQLKNLLAFRSN